MCMERGGTVATEEDWRNVNVYPEWVDVYHVNGWGVAQIARELDFPRTTISSLFNGRSNAELFQFALEELK